MGLNSVFKGLMAGEWIYKNIPVPMFHETSFTRKDNFSYFTAVV
jgi:hypothetical protein